MIPERLTVEEDSEYYLTNSSYFFSNKIQRNYLLLMLLTFPLLTIFGNLLVVISVVKERCLRNTTNYYIVSLAIADISLAVSVMPMCTWLEVNNGFWEFLGVYCDIFMMLDVMFCTSSILNLAAISIDRYIAVSRPLSYSNNQKFHRVYITIGLTWLLSFLIALPIACGLNNTKDRKENECKFSNPTFIILSSMISFYIPSVIVSILYYRIFLIIKKQAQAKIKRQCGKLFENIHNSQLKETTSICEKSELISISNHNTPKIESSEVNKNKSNNLLYPDSNVIRNPFIIKRKPIMDPSISSQSKLNDNKFEHNQESRSLLTDEIKIETSKNIFQIKNVQTFFRKKLKPKRSTERDGDSDDEPLSLKTSNLRLTLQLSTLHTTNLIKSTLMLPLRNRKKDQSERYLARREKKAIKTLAIVLVVFLICWVPFFTLNMINAICMRFSFSNNNYLCSLANSKTGSVAVWLGYTNSCVNPIIYTIFNGEFRRSFRKILRL